MRIEPCGAFASVYRSILVLAVTAVLLSPAHAAENAEALRLVPFPKEDRER